MTLPPFIPPELATAVNKPPAEDFWVHEIKFDGYRMICRIEKGTATLFSRNQIDWTKKVPTIAQALAALPAENAFVDGEVVSIDSQGRTSFEALQNALGGSG